jgi:hypothetical protein
MSEVCSRPSCEFKQHPMSIYCPKHATIHRRQTGRYLIAAAPVREHLELLNQAGMSCEVVAKKAGLNWRLVRNVWDGQGKILAKNAEKILAVEVPSERWEESADSRFIPNTGTQRRLQALVAIGYTNEALAGMLGYSKDQFGYLAYEDHPYVFAKTARRVKALYERLQDSPAPESYGGKRARLRAQRKGWLPPIAWDAETIDDPAAKPMVGGGEDDWFDAYLDAVELGRSEKEIAASFGLQVGGLRKRLARKAEKIA